ncbi:MAG: hypothetical protein ABW321_33460 [Polyangiales bacterium]
MIHASLLWASVTVSAQSTPSDPSAPAASTAPTAAPTPATADVGSATPATTPALRVEALPIDQDYEQGIAAFELGKYREAAAAFEASFAKTQDPRALLKLGTAWTILEHPQPAVNALERYLQHADPQRDAESIATAKQEIERLRSVSGQIDLHLVPQEAVLKMDGEVIDAKLGEQLVAPGPHHFTASAEGYKPYADTVTVIAGRFTLEIALERVPPVVAVAAPKPAPVAPLAETADEADDEKSERCLLSIVCVGPVVALLGPPNLMGGGLHARIGRYLGIGVDYQVLPRMTFNPISVQTSLVSANARVYPFGGAFFLSGGIGYQSMQGEIREGNISVGARSGFPAAMASLGFMGRNGFVLGADLGAMFPLQSMRATLNADAAVLTQSGISQSDIDAARNKAEREVNNALGNVPVLFQVNLLRVGYLF